MALRIFKHADGGHYVIENGHNHSMKMDDGRWEPALVYRRVERGPTGQWQYESSRTFSTILSRWAERFEDTGETTARVK